MTVNKVAYPSPGCVVEFMQGNSPMQALVLEEQNGRLRLYAVNRRENNLPASRLLPWSGPSMGTGLSRQRMDEILEERKKRRNALSSEVSPFEIWKLIQGEMDTASTEWMADLIWEQPDIDQEAALGHALLATKTHFRFSAPHFEIFPEVVVEARIQEAEAARLREIFTRTGSQFFQRLWDIYCRKRPALSLAEFPDQELAEQYKKLIFKYLRDPDTTEDASIWQSLIKGLPASPHLPLYLATAWGLLPEHYNFWLDRIGFDSGDAWADALQDDCALLQKNLAALVQELQLNRNPAQPQGSDKASQDAPGLTETPSGNFTDEQEYAFVSIDPQGALDRDDAFFVTKTADGGFIAHVALACPAAAWSFGSDLDKAVLRRGTSLYLPEGDEHMLPAAIGYSLFSLDAGSIRPSLMLSVQLAASGEAGAITPRLTLVRVSDNLDLENCESVLNTQAELHDGDTAAEDSPFARAKKHSAMLHTAFELACLLQTRRIAAGAVITERPDPAIRLHKQNEQLQVDIVETPPANRTHLLVGELMVLANSMLAAWAGDHDIPLLYRTQDVALPREFAGVWTLPHDIARVMRSLPPSSLKSTPRRHSGLGLDVYATVSSPIRRYVDLLNQGQVISFLRNKLPLFGADELNALLPAVAAHLNDAVQVQRLRPRYWKLMFFRQRGDKKWWDALVAEENETVVTLSLPWAQLMIRGKRRQFSEKTYAGMPVQVRIGKVQPLLNEIQVLEVREA